MKTNVGNKERIARVVAGLALLNKISEKQKDENAWLNTLSIGGDGSLSLL